jgi:soluble lytic murein transglycosylase
MLAATIAFGFISDARADDRTYATPSVAAQAAFDEGYRAYRARDLPLAIDRLGYAASNNPALADYALYYLGLAQRDKGDTESAAGTLQRMLSRFPNSVNSPPAMLALAEIALRGGRAAEAAATAARSAATAVEVSVEQASRLCEARALVADGKYRDGYRRAMALREDYPRAETDAPARQLAYSILREHLDASSASPVEYHRDEGELLLREGDLSAAGASAIAGLAFSPAPSVRAELVWIEARAWKAEAERARRAIREYLRLAPRGPSASAALEALALIQWHDIDYAGARATFGKIVAQFPSSAHAPGAMYRIGRIFEEEKKFDDARAEYRRLEARYHQSDAAEDARFRVGWTYYMARRWSDAAGAFAASRAHAANAQERDMYDYWRARSIERSGDRAGAATTYAAVARSVESNYYPALAERRSGPVNVDLPAAHAADPVLGEAPAMAAGAEFHLERLNALRDLDLKELEPGELRAIEKISGNEPGVRGFVLAALAAADAWHEVILAATRMEKHGVLGRDESERMRYPRAYFPMFEDAARASGIDAYLVISLARQESLFDPYATSSSNARGLMQLMAPTARRIAPEAGVNPDEVHLFDPIVNVRIGTAYLKGLLAMFDHDDFRAVAAYNGGEHAVQKWSAQFPGDDDEWVENIGYKETRDYVKKVIGGRREYELLYPRAHDTVPASK